MENSSENIIKKQLVMKSLPVPKDIQEHMKSFIFLDENQAHILKNRKDVIKSLKNELFYDLEIDHWALSTFTTQLQAVNCEICGNFLQISNMNIE